MRCFLFAPGRNEGGAGHEQRNNGGIVRQARIYPVRNTPLLNNKPLRLFLKAGRCHTKYATHVDLPVGSTSSFGRAFVIFIVQSMTPGPNFVHVWGTHAHALANEASFDAGKKKSPSHKGAKGFERRVFARANTFRYPIP